MTKYLLFFCFLLIIILPNHAEQVSPHRQVRNLTAFTKLYGYVRHFHPSDEAQEIDWDRFSSYGSEKVINARDDKELKRILNELFIPIAPTLKLYSSKHDNKYDYSQLVPPDTTEYFHTCWQYRGYSNKPGSYYQSYRTYRPFKITKVTSTRLEASLSLPMDQFSNTPQGIRLSLSARKTENDTLACQIVGVCDQYNMDDSLLTSNWERKSFTFEGIESDNPTIWIYFGDFTKIQVDSIKCEALIGNKWKQVYYNDFAASAPGFLPAGLDINTNPYFGKLPNNDVIVESIEDNNLLCIQKSTTDLPYTLGFYTKLFDEEVAPNTLIDKPLIKGLSCQFPLSLYCIQNQTYPPADKAKLSELQEKLGKIDTHDRTNHYNYLAALVIYWNELQHFFPYWQYAETDWSRDLNSALKQTLTCKNLLEFVLIMSELSSKTHDSHATFFDDKIDNKMPGFNAEPLDGKWIVTQVADDSLVIPLGSEVLRIDNNSIIKYINKYRKYYDSGSRQHADKYLFTRTMRVYQDSIATFTLKTPDNKSITREVPFAHYTIGEWYNRSGKFTAISDSIYYVNLGQKGVNSAELDSLMLKLTEAKGIVFDLRDYPQRTKLLNYLLTKPDTLKCHFTMRSIYPDCQFLPAKEMPYDNWNLQPQEPHIKAKCVFLCGGYSISYCESVLMEIKYNKLGIIIGQPTAGVTGNVVMGSYPCDLGAWWTGMFVQNPDGSRFHGMGIIPDIIVPRTIEAVSIGKDMELDTAINFLQNENQ